MSNEGQQTVIDERDIGRLLRPLIPFAGSVLFFWLSLKWPIVLLRPLPTFAGRLYQIRVPLREVLAAILCMICGALLLTIEKRKKLLHEIPAGMAQNPGKKLRLWVAAILVLFLCIGMFILIGHNFVKFLWPSQTEMLVSALNGLFVVGYIFGPFLRKPRNVTQVPFLFGKRNDGSGKAAVNSLALFAAILVVSVAAIFAIHLVTKTLMPTYDTAVILLCGIPFFLTCAVAWALLVPWDTIFGHLGWPDFPSNHPR